MTHRVVLAYMLGLTYCDLTDAGAGRENFKHQFPGGLNDLLYLRVEGLYNHEYRNEDSKTALRQLTRGEDTEPREHPGIGKGWHKVIISPNTNQTDLYGLIRADPASTGMLVTVSSK
jgi:hypothetical protein